MKAQKSIKSFVKRNKRLTSSQKKFLESKNENSNFHNAIEILNYHQIFNNNNPCIMDIGFGDGKLLISIAKENPEKNFIGVEVYQSGIGRILKQISKHKLSNLVIFNHDAVDLLENYIENSSLFGISLFFPDPWPKKKHHKRRIINTNFINLISLKLKKRGFIKIATDWSNYSNSIIDLFNQNDNFERINDISLYKFRHLTKFEKRGMLLGHQISEVCYLLK